MIEWLLNCNLYGLLFILALLTLVLKGVGYMGWLYEKSGWLRNKTIFWEIEVGFRNMDKTHWGILAFPLMIDISESSNKKQFLIGGCFINIVLAIEVSFYGKRSK